MSHLVLQLLMACDSDHVFFGRFIKTYGTHIVVGFAVGGQDVICIKQRPSSTIPPAELKGYLEDLGDIIFSDGTSPLQETKTKDGKKKVSLYLHCRVSLTLRLSVNICSLTYLGFFAGS